jgi:hypothetical protein
MLHPQQSGDFAGIVAEALKTGLAATPEYFVETFLEFSFCYGS